jgi:polyisoprenoid-binding protein YceI
MSLVRTAMTAWIAAGSFAGLGLALAGQSLNAGQSEIAFIATQTGVPLEGSFSRFDAKVNLDPDKPQSGTVVFSVDTSSVEFASAEAQKELSKPDWFDTARFPRAEFRSDRIRSLGNGRYEISGALTIKGRTRQVVFPAALDRSGAAIVATGALAIKRLEFGVGAGEWSDTSLVEDEVKIRFKISLSGAPG